VGVFIFFVGWFLELSRCRGGTSFIHVSWCTGICTVYERERFLETRHGDTLAGDFLKDNRGASSC